MRKMSLENSVTGKLSLSLTVCDVQREQQTLSYIKNMSMYNLN